MRLTDELRQRLGVSERTWRRWKSSGEIPRSASLALQHLAGVVPGWPGFVVEDRLWLRTPGGSRIHQEVVGNLDYYAYLQRSLGYLSEWVPAPAKNGYDIRLIEPWMIDRLQQLGVLLHNQPPADELE